MPPVTKYLTRKSYAKGSLGATLASRETSISMEVRIKGIILAGGLGTRLDPLTRITSKQLLPVFDKPMIYYSLSTLMLANIREISIISNPTQQESFEKLLGDGSELGLRLTYLVQNNPGGIAESLLIAEEYLCGEKCALILGDNIFHGSGLGRRLESFTEIEGAQIFGYHVQNPSAYGVANLDDMGKVVQLIEKPTQSTSKVAIPGIYFFDNKASALARSLHPSTRGELEILDLLNLYLLENALSFEMLPRGTAWFDSGTFNDLHEASSYVKLMQERTGERVGDPIEVSKIRRWTSQDFSQ